MWQCEIGQGKGASDGDQTLGWDKASRSEEGVHRSLVAKILGQLSVVVICF